MAADLKPVHEYIRALEKELACGIATEQSYRPALKALIESLADGVEAINDPRRIECGAPDFTVMKGLTTISHVEAKDIGKSLDEAEKSPQLQRYLTSLTNLVLTDYLEFRWYVDGDGDIRLSARLGITTKDGKIKRDKDGVQAVAGLLDSFLAHTAKRVGTPRELAVRLARLAHTIRDRIIQAFEKEAQGSSLHTQLLAFRDNLIPNLSVQQFADMYAQTTAYGFFAARCTNSNSKSFTRQNAANETSYRKSNTENHQRPCTNIFGGFQSCIKNFLS